MNMHRHLYTSAPVGLALALVLLTTTHELPADQAPPTVRGERVVIIAQGASGSEEYAGNFIEAVAQWTAAAHQGEAQPLPVQTREALQQAIEAALEAKPDELWVVLIGHGTFDGRSARFALTGPDITSDDLAAWLQPWEGDLVVVNSSSASAPFLPALAGPNRVIITATKSGHEVFYSRFGTYLATALLSPEADLNKDEQVSVLEAFLLAADQTAEFFTKEGRLATEHAIIDDNGDGKGTPAEWFEGLRAVKQATDAEADGLLARNVHLVPNDLDRSLSPEVRKRRNALELEAELLRSKRQELGDDAYYERLEAIFVEIAKIYQIDS